MLIITKNQWISIFVILHLRDEICALGKCWRKKVRARKKFLVRQLNEGMRYLRDQGVTGRNGIIGQSTMYNGNWVEQPMGEMIFERVNT